MHYYLMFQNDFHDYIHHNESIEATDIANGRCSWLIVTVLDKANSLEKKILMDNYGVANETAVNNVKEVFDQMNIEAIYREAISAMVVSIRYYIQCVPDQNIQKSLLVLLNQLIDKHKHT